MKEKELLEQAVALAPKVRAISEEVLSRHIRREEIVWPTWLALVSGRPAFFLGPPGIDKTGVIQALAKRIDGAVFFDALMPTIVSVEQLLVESTAIEEVPTENGGKLIRTRDTLGRAASAHIVFCDEIWKAEARVLQILLDLALGHGVRHEGQLVKTPLLAFLGASNEVPNDPEGNLGAIWSRMTIRVQVLPLDRAGKKALVAARLQRYRQAAAGEKTTSAAQLTLEEVETLRQARLFVEVPDDVVETVLDILQELVEDTSQDFSWAWSDDRRFGRIFDVMQANALLNGRTKVTKADLAVLEWLLWDTPEQIPVVKAKVAPYCRTALIEARELVDVLLAPGGTVDKVLQGDRSKGVQALTQCESAEEELKRLKGEAEDEAMASKIADLISQVQAIREDVIAVITTGQRRQREGGEGDAKT
jgi:MoxR-like ATPase